MFYSSCRTFDVFSLVFGKERQVKVSKAGKIQVLTNQVDYGPKERAYEVVMITSLMFKDKPPDTMLMFKPYHKCQQGFKATLEFKRSTKKREEDKRFQPPDLEQDKHQGVNVFILIKETPPDATYKPNPNQEGMTLIIHDHISNSVLSIADEADLRTNLFEEGGDDMIMETPKEKLIPELEPEEQLVAEETKFGKECGDYVILTSLVLIHDHQMGMCLICTLFPLSSFVPMGFLDKVFNEANVSHPNHPFVDPKHGKASRKQPKETPNTSSSFYAIYKPKKSPNEVNNFVFKRSDEKRS